MLENAFDLKSVLENPTFVEIYEDGFYNYIFKQINSNYNISEEDNLKTFRFAFLLYTQELLKLRDDDNYKYLEEGGFEKVYFLLRSINVTSIEADFNAIIGFDEIDAEVIYFFLLAVSGLFSKNSIKIRIDLKRYNANKLNSAKSWDKKVLQNVLKAIILLTRKSNGAQDINDAIQLINELKAQQKDFEESYLAEKSALKQVESALDLVGYYHLCKILTETAKYLINGYDYELNLLREIQRHSRHARDIFKNSPRLLQITLLVEYSCILFQRNSIWYKTLNLSTNIGQLCKKLGKQNMIELLPSQQEAIEKHLLDASSNATIVQMPTSAGKTLLAEFCILQTKALNDNAKIVYVLPTKALVNQVTTDLREDFSELEITVEKSSGANEVDPSEDLFLSQDIDVLVLTSEKLDLLVRKKHAVVEGLSLVIVDEAHNIKDGARGARLELLLAIIKREMPNTRFLILSPFLANASALKEWLAEGKNAIDPILVDWKPAEKVFLGIKENRANFSLEFLPSAYDLNAKERELVIDDNIILTSTAAKSRLFEYTSKYFSNSKSILYLCWGKKSADNRANELYNYAGDGSPSDLLSLAKRYIQEEVGEDTILTKVLDKGIAIHHSGLTEDTKALVEHLIRKNLIKHICATTTVAQGMNFPVSTVFLDDTRKGSGGRRLSINEFQNIAGRAGRTLVDSVGKIVFPFNSANNIRIAKDYLKGEAEHITSALINLILNSDSIISAFSKTDNAQERAKLYEANDSLSSLVQYVIHLINVFGGKYYIDELEELFKDSLGYYLSNKEQRTQFIKVCQTLYNDLENRTSKGVLKYADVTGFSVPSVLSIMNSKKNNPEIAAPETWESQNLFSNHNDYLTKKIDVISTLREVHLGTDSNSAQFNPENISKILIGWVNGQNISSLSSIHPLFANNQEQRINEFVTYLSSTIFKSSWGLSALEGIVRSNNDDLLAQNSHISSMIYYGVNTKEAIALRMLGAPRGISNNLASQISQVSQPKTFNDIRKQIKSLKNSDWDDIRPKNSKLNGEEWKTITEILIK